MMFAEIDLLERHNKAFQNNILASTSQKSEFWESNLSQKSCCGTNDLSFTAHVSQTNIYWQFFLCSIMNSARLKGTFIEFSCRLVGHKVGKPHFCQTKKINQPQTLCSSTDWASSAHVQSWMSWIFEQNLWDETGLKWWDKATCRKLDEMRFSLGWNDIWKENGFTKMLEVRTNLLVRLGLNFSTLRINSQVKMIDSL